MKRHRIGRSGVAAGLLILSAGGLAGAQSLAQIQAYGLQETPPLPVPPPAASDGLTVPVRTIPPQFREALAPYGRWVDMPHWGWCWRPSAEVVGIGFRPYVTGGRWVYTSDGWTFDTKWAWGWAAFHYGRWFYEEGNGWLWLPGFAWGASWVSWRFGDGYVGWAPLGPPGFDWPNVTFTAWNFAEIRYLASRSLITHVSMYPGMVARYFALTRPIRDVIAVGSVRWYTGPQPRAFEQHGVHVDVVERPRPQSLRLLPGVRPPPYGRRIRPAPPT